MATQTTSDSRNRSRRGGRDNRGRSRNSNNGRSGGGGGRRRGGDDNRPYRVPRPKKKLSLWARILGIFGIGKKAAPKKRPSPAKNSSRPREEKRHEPVELTAPRLFVGNLSYDATDADIENLLNGIGQVKTAEIVTNQRTQRSKGFAFVEMLSLDDAKRAIEVLHNEQFLGRRLIVSPAKSEGVHPNATAEEDQA